MKSVKFLLLIGCVLSVQRSIAQIEKGTKLIGGSFWFTTSRNDYPYFVLNPNVGRFLNKHFCVGMGLPMEYGRIEYFNSASLRNNIHYDVGIEAFLRYYLHLGDKNYFFANSYAKINWFNAYTEDGLIVDRFLMNQQYFENNGQIKNWVGRELGLGLGYGHLIAPDIGLETRFDYGISRNQNLSIQFLLGLQIYLAAKKHQAKDKSWDNKEETEDE